MKVHSAAEVQAVHAFDADGQNSAHATINIQSYYPGASLAPRVEVRWPNAGTMVFDATDLLKAIQHCAVKL